MSRIICRELHTHTIRFAASALAMACLVAVLGAVTTARAAPITIDWVTVADPGNTADTTGYGAVGYSYRIGKYAVTIGQYTEFLNAVAATDPYGLYNTSMGTDLNIAGISRTGTSGEYSYSVMNNGGDSGSRPITYISWFDAARFANWMQNGQGSGSTETGAYTLGGATSGDAVAVNAGATFSIPTENEWYKAAYFSPIKGGVGVAGYYAYATQSDVAPGNVVGGAANQANYITGWPSSPKYSVTQSGSFSVSQNYLTDVGAFTNSASYYGTFDQSGNVYQWVDLTGAAGPTRKVWGGVWADNYPPELSSAAGYPSAPSDEAYAYGFRLASPVPVPEPASLGLAATGGLAALGWTMLRRRRRTEVRAAASWASQPMEIT